MRDLRQQLEQLHGRIALLAIGNTEGGDDALGVRLGEQLITAGVADVYFGGVAPERVLAQIPTAYYAHLIFLDAVNVGAAAGSVVFMSAGEVRAKFPQVSTHRLSLALLADWIESAGPTRVWLLGVQPQSMKPGAELAPEVRETLLALNGLLIDRLRGGVVAC